MSIRLVIADDHQVIRTGLATLLAGTDIEIVGEAANGKEAIKQAEKIQPDVLLLDIRMPDGDGLQTLEKLRAKLPNLKIVMLSTYDNPTYIARAVALGANDYVLKGSSREDLIATIKAAAVGESPSRSGELRRVASAMKVRQLVEDDEVPLDAARNASLAARGARAKQPGNRPLAGNQRRDRQGARAEHPPQNRRKRSYPGGRLGRAQGPGRLETRGQGPVCTGPSPPTACESISGRLDLPQNVVLRLRFRPHQLRCVAFLLDCFTTPNPWPLNRPT